MKGETVIVRAFRGRPHIRRVWESTDTTVYVCSEERYQRLLVDEYEWPPTGFPREDVFHFDPNVVDKLMQEWETNPSVWEQLEPWKGGENQ